MAKSKPDSEFWAAYRDPRWQRRRLEIMQRAEFKCEVCGADSVTLNVHHRHYVKGRQPWEYADEELRCLCEECHAEVSEAMAGLKLWAGKLNDFQVRQLIGIVKAMLVKDVADAGGSLAIDDLAEIWGFAGYMYPARETVDLTERLVALREAEMATVADLIEAVKEVGDRARAAGSTSGRRPL